MTGRARTADDLRPRQFLGNWLDRRSAGGVRAGSSRGFAGGLIEVLASRDVRYLLQSTLAFDASIFLFWVLATGGCLVVPTDEQAADPFALVGLIARHGVTDAFFVPHLYEAVLQGAKPGTLHPLQRLCTRRCGRRRSPACTTPPCPARLLRRLRAY